MSRVKRDRQTADRIAAELAAHADALSVRMLQVTVPIYQPAPPKDPYLVGSGVLVTLAGDRFLLTARHVLDWLDRGQVVVGISPEYASIAGTLWRIRANDAQSDSEDHIDLGLVQVRGGPWHTPSTRDRNHQRSYRDDENWPSLKGVSLSKLGAVSGLSRSACQKIRTGTLVRHPWHCEKLKAARLNGDSRTWLPASEKRSKCRFSITEMSLSYHRARNRAKLCETDEVRSCVLFSGRVSSFNFTGWSDVRKELTTAPHRTRCWLTGAPEFPDDCGERSNRCHHRVRPVYWSE